MNILQNTIFSIGIVCVVACETSPSCTAYKNLESFKKSFSTFQNSRVKIGQELKFSSNEDLTAAKIESFLAECKANLDAAKKIETNGYDQNVYKSGFTTDLSGLCDELQEELFIIKESDFTKKMNLVQIKLARSMYSAIRPYSINPYYFDEICYKENSSKTEESRIAKEIEKNLQKLKMESMLDRVEIKNLDWSKSSYGASIGLSANIVNNSDDAIKDPVITCTFFTNSRTEVGKVTKTVFEIIEPGKIVRFKNLQFGSVDENASKGSCSIVDLKLM